MATARSSLFVKTVEPLRPESGGPLHELAIELNRAHTTISVCQILRNYCSRALASPAGMIFSERNGRLDLVVQWRSKNISEKLFSEEAIRKGPVTEVLGKSGVMFWSETESSPDICRFLRRLLPDARVRNAVFLPVRSKRGHLAVVAMLAPIELTPRIRADMYRLEQIVADSMVRARVYDETVTARIAAERANRQHKESLSLIAHELRSPMTPILSWAVALTSGVLPSEQQSLALEGIIRNVRALNYLIDDLFDFARIASGKLHLEPVEMRIQEVVREALTATQQTAEEKKLRITTDISEGIPPFAADAHRVRQVLINLLNNSMKFTPPGGSITLKVARRGDDVECAVTDTGKGIGPQFLPFVFDRYRQENRGHKAKTKGLGLGLSIVREIIELHGGTVKARSRGPDQGTTLSFRLPLNRHKSAA